jgi:hypothetical protein
MGPVDLAALARFARIWRSFAIAVPGYKGEAAVVRFEKGNTLKAKEIFLGERRI